MIKKFDTYKFMEGIIDSNIKKSHKDFGLKLRDEDIAKEKDVIISTFSKYGLKKMYEYSDNEYRLIYNKVINEILEKLEEQLKYYFYNTPEGEVKTRYNCHIQNVVSEIFMKYD